MADEQPEVAVTLAFRAIESRLRFVLKLRAPRLVGTDAATARQLAHLAVEHGIIDRGIADAINGLGKLRDLAVHGGRDGIDKAKTLEFLLLADAVLTALDLDV